MGVGIGSMERPIAVYLPLGVDFNPIGIACANIYCTTGRDTADRLDDADLLILIEIQKQG